MRVLLADDEVRVRFALRVLLQQQPGVELAGEAVRASDLLDALAVVRPDVLLLDWELPGSGGRQLMAALRSVCPRLPVIALSGRPEVRREALAAGADSFVCKSDPPDCLLSALDNCCDGLRYSQGVAYVSC
jgi:DNA-binding NarL/FixJ family response regulator